MIDNFISLNSRTYHTKIHQNPTSKRPSLIESIKNKHRNRISFTTSVSTTDSNFPKATPTPTAYDPNDCKCVLIHEILKLVMTTEQHFNIQYNISALALTSAEEMIIQEYSVRTGFNENGIICLNETNNLLE